MHLCESKLSIDGENHCSWPARGPFFDVIPDKQSIMVRSENSSSYYWSYGEEYIYAAMQWMCKKSSTYSLKDYPLIIKIIKMTLDILKNYICSKQTDGQTNAEPVNMSSLHLQCDPDNIEKRAKMLILKKTAPQNHILDNDDEPSSMYNAVQRLKKDLDFFVIIVMMYSFNEIGFQEALIAKLWKKMKQLLVQIIQPTYCLR